MIGEGMIFLLGMATGGVGLWVLTMTATVRGSRLEACSNAWTVDSIRARIELERCGDSQSLSNPVPVTSRHERRPDSVAETAARSQSAQSVLPALYRHDTVH